MNTPYHPRRDVFDADAMLAASDGLLNVDAIIEKIGMQTGDSFKPQDKALRALWLMWHSSDGRAVIEWWLDMTLRAPFPPLGSDFQAAAMAAARHQARSGIGEVLIEALAAGKELHERHKGSRNIEGTL